MKPNEADDVVLSRDDDQLVAYLDGQLDAVSSEQMDRRVAGDAQLRQRVERLRKAWELLDALPKANLDENFTQTTIEMVAVAEERAAEAEIHSRRRWQWFAGIAGAASLAAAAVIGFWITNQAVPDPNRQLLDDLPLVEELDLYQQIGSVEYLEQLADAGVFPGESENGR